MVLVVAVSIDREYKEYLKLKIMKLEKTRNNTIDKDTITIPIKHTQFLLVGKKIKENLWDLYLVDPRSTYKELIKENMTTIGFDILSSMTLKTPFPYNE